MKPHDTEQRPRMNRYGLKPFHFIFWNASGVIHGNFLCFLSQIDSYCSQISFPPRQGSEKLRAYIHERQSSSAYDKLNKKLFLSCLHHPLTLSHFHKICVFHLVVVFSHVKWANRREAQSKHLACIGSGPSGSLCPLNCPKASRDEQDVNYCF